MAASCQRAAISTSVITLGAEGRIAGPAAAVAALFVLCKEAEEVDPLLLLLPADHVIPDVGAFQDSILKGVAAARSGRIVTFGIKPSRPETGYGYIEVEEGAVSQSEATDVRCFVEKTDRRTAEGFFQSGRHCWNAGIFLSSAKTLLDRTHVV